MLSLFVSAAQIEQNVIRACHICCVCLTEYTRSGGPAHSLPGKLSTFCQESVTDTDPRDALYSAAVEHTATL